MEINERIKALRIARSMSQEDLAKRVGYSGRSSIAKVEAGQLDISQSMIKKYADALGVTPVYLLYGNEEENRPVKNIIPFKTKLVPLIGDIACGKPVYATEQRGTYVITSDGINADFCLRAVGDSMIGARIHDGDIVFCVEQSSVDNGEIAAVIIDDEATLKRVYFERDKLVLAPENPAYPPLVYVGEELQNVRIIGKAVAFQSHVK